VLKKNPNWISGHAIDQGVSHWHVTITAWVQPQASSREICGEQSFLEVFWFHLPISILPNVLSLPYVTQNWGNGPFTV
jgi:hypothetical protein